MVQRLIARPNDARTILPLTPTPHESFFPTCHRDTDEGEPAQESIGRRFRDGDELVDVRLKIYEHLLGRVYKLPRDGAGELFRSVLEQKRPAPIDRRVGQRIGRFESHGENVKTHPTVRERNIPDRYPVTEGSDTWLEDLERIRDQTIELHFAESRRTRFQHSVRSDKKNRGGFAAPFERSGNRVRQADIEPAKLRVHDVRQIFEENPAVGSNARRNEKHDGKKTANEYLRLMWSGIFMFSDFLFLTLAPRDQLDPMRYPAPDPLKAIT